MHITTIHLKILSSEFKLTDAHIRRKENKKLERSVVSDWHFNQEQLSRSRMWSILTPQTGAALSPPHQRSLFRQQPESITEILSSVRMQRTTTEWGVSPKRHIHTQSLYLRLKENRWEEVHKVHRVREPECCKDMKGKSYSWNLSTMAS